MAGLNVACPACTAKLKLPDRSLLGKKVKCPKCGHAFVLQAPTPTPIPIEVVDEETPLPGKNPQWIPDEPAASPANTSTAASAASDPAPQASHTPAGLAALLNEEPASATTENPLDFLNETSPAPAATDVASLFTESTAAPLSPPQTSTAPPAPVTRSRRRKRRRSSNGPVIIVAVLLITAAGGGFYFVQQNNAVVTIDPTDAAPTESATDPAAAAATKPANRATAANFNIVKDLSPTTGKPIELYHLPAGVRLVIHLRPAELWAPDAKSAELRAAFGPLGSWLDSQITSLTKAPPTDIEELLIGIILGPRGTAPELAAVVHYAEPQQRADLLQRYQGEPLEEFNTNIKLADGNAYHLIDDSTVAICPEIYADDLKTFAQMPAMTSDDVTDILRETDRDRLISVVFTPADVEQHVAALFPESAALVVNKTLSFLGNDIAAAAWSLHLEEDFFSELVVQGQNNVGPLALSKRFRERVDVLPEMLLTSVQKMEPQRAGYRKLIGRYPAMMKVVSLTTRIAVDGRHVRLGTLLPPQAGPNLALGTLLTWDESTRTNFSAAVPVVAKAEPRNSVAQLPFAERMNRKIDVDFRRTPLQEAFDLIADEAKIPITIDGDALKLAGFTKNMPQTFQATEVPVLEAIYGIIKNYEAESIPLVIVIDNAAGTIEVTTRKVAADTQKTPYDIKTKGFQYQP